MASLNQVTLIGRLGRDPELRYTQGGQAVANFTMATSEVYNDKQGQRQEKTEWHRVVVWAKLAELCGQYLGKGRLVYIEGKLQTREWNDREGHKRTTTEVVAAKVLFLESRAGANNNDSRQPTEPDNLGYQELDAGATAPAATDRATMTTSRPFGNAGHPPPYNDPYKEAAIAAPMDDDVPF